MTRTSLTPFLWLTALVGCTGVLTATPQPVIGQTNSPVLLVQQSDELEEAEQLNQQFIQLYQQGKYNEAIPIAERVLKIRERLLGQNHSDVATSLNNLAALYVSLGRYSEAEPLYQRALAIKEKALGTSHSSIATSLNNLALLYVSQGRYSEAEPLYQRSLAIREKALGGEHPDVATSLNNLAYLYDSQGRYSKAELLYQRSLAIFETVFGSEHPNVATSLNNLAVFYVSQGRYSEAEPLYQRALAIDQKTLGGEHPDVATSFNNLAELYVSLGRYSEAEPLYQRSLGIYENALGSEHPNVALNLNNLAELYRSQGRYSEAEPLYQRSLAIREKALGGEHPDVATSLNNLATLYDNQKRYSEAEPLYQRSLAIREKALGGEHPNVAISLNNLAALYQNQGRYSQAEPLYQRSATIWQKALGGEHPNVAISLNNLAALYQNQGRYSEAEPLYQRSATIWQKALGGEHPNVAISLNNLAAFYQAQGDLTQSIHFLSQGLEVEEQNLKILLATGSERQKQDSIKTLLGRTYQAVSLHIKNAPNNSEAARLALTTLLRRKGRILDVVTNDLRLLRENITPENQQFLDELQAVRTQLANFIYNKPENLSQEQYRQQVTSLRKKADNLEAELSRRSAEFRTLSEPVTIEALQEFIPQNAALVELVLYKPYDAKATPGNRFGKPHYAAYILKSSGEPQWLDLGEAEPIHKAAFLRFSLDLKDRGDAERQKTEAVKNNARKLDKLLMEPIRQNLGDVRHIILSPDAHFNLIPFAALVDENNQYLVENYQITYLTTGRDLVRLQNEYSHRQSPVIFANPNYDQPGEPTTFPRATNPVGTLHVTSLPERNVTSRRERNVTSLRERNVASISRDIEMSFKPLPGTAEEANVISALIPNFTLFTESKATENAIKQLESPNILHIATHGFFLRNLPRITPDDTSSLSSTNSRPATPPQENPLLRSGLALAGFNPRQSGSEDGVLTALEVANLKLRGTKLVVLSACETGLGKIENGEGVYGLRRAFTLAGAESQLMSLWTVSDAGTKELMIKYYQRLIQNQGRSEALRQTQLEMLNSSEYQHPYYWAAFIPAGDWTAMER